MLRIAAALAVFVVVFCFATASSADQRRIAVLQPDEELLRAISLSLSPWGIETIRSDATVPEPSQPEAAQVASRLARQLEVEALVWMTRLDAGSLLWVYDTGTGDVTTRMLQRAPPFDGAGAAAVALSVKTVLRASAVAPPDERFGSEPMPSRRERIWAVEGGAGGRWIGFDQVALRGELASVVWFPATRRVLGLSLESSWGPGLSIDTPNYEGRYRELVLGARLRFGVVRTPDFTTLVALGAGGHWTQLRGTLAADSRAANVDRVNVSIDFETSVNFHVSSRVYLGASVGGSYFPRYRRYLVDGDPVFSPWSLSANLAGHCGVQLF